MTSLSSGDSYVVSIATGRHINADKTFEKIQNFITRSVSPQSPQLLYHIVTENV